MCDRRVESKNAVPKVTPAGTENGSYVTCDPGRAIGRRLSDLNVLRLC